MKRLLGLVLLSLFTFGCVSNKSTEPSMSGDRLVQRSPVKLQAVFDCPQIERFEAQCDSEGEISVIIDTTRRLNNYPVTFSIDGDEGLRVTSRICGDTSITQLCCFGPGDHVVTLLDPVGCDMTTTVTCEGTIVVTGPCCHPDGSCTETTEIDCTGVYQGDNTNCFSGLCPQPSLTGACCVEAGSCTETLEADCVGTYQGDNTTCDPNLCPQPPAVGACCFSDGSCLDSIELECAGDYQGDGVACSPNPCPQPAAGACCLSTGVCSEILAVNCIGTYQGDGTTCSPDPCDQPPVTGACCRSSGSCTEVLASSCTGVFLGDGTNCDPNLCPLPPGCGNGIIEAGEQCDPPDGVTCDANCQNMVIAPVCGNGIVEAGEDCDPPNGTTCDIDCQTVVVVPDPVCGNGVVEDGEQCDPPDGVTCDIDCQTVVVVPDPVCGNEVVESGEQCDPPNGTTCDANCQTIFSDDSMNSTNNDSGVAPLGVMFDVSDAISGVVQPPVLNGTSEYFRFQYTWDFGDDRGESWAVTGRSKNEASGHIVAHVFEIPGDYVITLTVVDDTGFTFQYTDNIHIDDPEVTFAGNTFYVSATGNDSNSGSMANPFQSWSRGIDALGISGPTRVLFKRGDVFNTNGATVEFGFTGPLHVSGYGIGNAPIIFATGGDGNSVLSCFSGSGLTVHGLHFQGVYDPSTGMGNKPNGISMLDNNQFMTIFNNSFSNLGLNIHLGQLGETQDSVVAENHITAWQNYGVLSGDLFRVAVIGNNIRQDVNAQTGDGKLPAGTQPDFADHGPLRLRDLSRTVVSYNDLFSNTGWSAGHDENGKGHQPCIRFGSGGVADNSIVSDNWLEGGFNLGGSGPSNSAAPSTIGTVIWENNRWLATATTRYYYATNMGGTVVRNNVFIRPNFTPFDGERMLRVILFETIANDTVPGNEIVRNYVYNNTYVSLADGTSSGKGAAAFLEVDPGGLTNIEAVNNLMYAPTATDSSNPFIRWEDGDTSQFVSDCNLYFGPSPNFIRLPSGNTTLAAWIAASGNDVNSLWQEDPMLVDYLNGDYSLDLGSAAIDSGCDVDVWDDFDKVLRPQLNGYDIGAFEKN